ncbi:selenide, water dikinase SelD [Cereibacter sphaeroides]|uniref:selenide, water dikinase SelD n=1 Tax=Cereibacter sphaeroides TaxID=1063 RepID=UPI001F1A5E23|nr:selenide, water dikinase SelD [Cereibacter sphaeroides]MCE6950655.1 selenide, water dikinase SelD [Cereibacter sphaeroides]
MQALPPVRDLVLIGGGHAHALVLRQWGMRPLAGVRVTVVDPNPVAPYTGMLPGHIAGHYAREEMMIDLVRLARHAGARVILDRAVGIDRQARRVLLAARPPIAYDLASIDIGIASGLPGVPGAAEHAVAAKPLGAYAERWAAFVARRLPRPRIVVVGGGAGGVELAMASAHRLRGEGAEPEVTVLESGPAALPGLGDGARRALLGQLERMGIRLLTGTTAERIEVDGVVLDGNRRLSADFVLSVAGAQPQRWLAGTGLQLHDGFIVVGPTLRSSDPAIFAAGDCAHLAHAPRPKAGVFAVREAPVLFHNLQAALAGGRMRAYRPQRDYLKLISCGDRAAVADKFGLRLEGAWLWRWKDRIDRAFMEKFRDYPGMAVVPPSQMAEGLDEILSGQPLCGGCGAKLAAGGLEAALAEVPAPRRPDVVSGPGDDAAVLRSGSGLQVLTTDHLRAFTQDARLMARIAALHALGDVWAMGAAPQVALAQVILPRMAPRMQAGMLSEVMASAAEVFSAAGADVVGGHSSVGAELTIGFTVTGLAERVIGKGGARPGDVLILTRPLGSGTILAAEMAGRPVPGLLLGEVVAGCLSQMQRPGGAAAQLLATAARAMTDVTGFGLAGHLLEMLAASGCAARLRLDAVPLLPGAEALAAAGHASSLAPANRAAAAPRMDLPDGPRAALLFDPQTAGGFLAAVPAEAAEALLAELRAMGEPAVRIGELVEGRPWISVSA